MMSVPVGFQPTHAKPPASAGGSLTSTLAKLLSVKTNGLK